MQEPFDVVISKVKVIKVVLHISHAGLLSHKDQPIGRMDDPPIGEPKTYLLERNIMHYGRLFTSQFRTVTSFTFLFIY